MWQQILYKQLFILVCASANENNIPHVESICSDNVYIKV